MPATYTIRRTTANSGRHTYRVHVSHGATTWCLRNRWNTTEFATRADAVAAQAQAQGGAK